MQIVLQANVCYARVANGIDGWSHTLGRSFGLSFDKHLVFNLYGYNSIWDSMNYIYSVAACPDVYCVNI